MSTIIIVTLQDGVLWHANTVFAQATGHGLRASIESSIPENGLISAKPVVSVVIRDGARRASSFPAVNVFSGLPGVVRVETRDDPNP